MRREPIQQSRVNHAYITKRAAWQRDLSMTQTGRLRLEHRHGWRGAVMD
ncbi:hypothetical protein [Desulfosporosinus sp. OT]|nr:hypothetical protein [Desulfosporosinus sp. OT]